MKASRSVQVMAAKRGHSFPPIWLKITLLNLPSAVRRLARERAPAAALVAGFGCCTAGVAFASAATCLRRAFAFAAFFLVFFIRVPSHGTSFNLLFEFRRR